MKEQKPKCWEPRNTLQTDTAILCDAFEVGSSHRDMETPLGVKGILERHKRESSVRDRELNLKKHIVESTNALWEMPYVLEPGLHVLIGPERSGKSAIAAGLAFDSYNYNFQTAIISTEEPNNVLLQKYKGDCKPRQGLEEYSMDGDGLYGYDFLAFIQEFATVRNGKMVVIDSFDALPPFVPYRDKKQSRIRQDRKTWIKELSKCAERLGIRIVMTVQDRPLHDSNDSVDMTEEETDKTPIKENEQPGYPAGYSHILKAAKSITELKQIHKSNLEFNEYDDYEVRDRDCIIVIEGERRLLQKELIIDPKLVEELLANVTTIKEEVAAVSLFDSPVEVSRTRDIYYYHEPVVLKDDPQYSVGLIGLPSGEYSLVFYYSPLTPDGEHDELQVLGHIDRIVNENSLSTRKQIQKIVKEREKKHFRSPIWIKKYFDSNRLTDVPFDLEKSIIAKVVSKEPIQIEIPGYVGYGAKKDTQVLGEGQIETWEKHLDELWNNPHLGENGFFWCDQIVHMRNKRFSIGLRGHLSSNKKGSPIDDFSFALFLGRNNDDNPKIIGGSAVSYYFDEEEGISKIKQTNIYVNNPYGYTLAEPPELPGNVLLKMILNKEGDGLYPRQLRLLLEGLCNRYAFKVCGAKKPFKNKVDHDDNIRKMFSVNSEGKPKKYITPQEQKVLFKDDLALIQNFCESLIINSKFELDGDDVDRVNIIKNIILDSTTKNIRRAKKIETETVWDKEKNQYIIRGINRYKTSDGHILSIQRQLNERGNEIELIQLHFNKDAKRKTTNLGIMTPNITRRDQKVKRFSLAINIKDVSAVLIPIDTPDSIIGELLKQRFRHIMKEMKGLHIVDVTTSDALESVEVGFSKNRWQEEKDGRGKSLDQMTGSGGGSHYDAYAPIKNDDDDINEVDGESNDMIHWTNWVKNPNEIDGKYVAYMMEQ